MSASIRLRSEWRSRVTQATYETVRSLNREGVHQFTVRQLFYQLVSRGVLRSTRQDYKNFDALLVRLRENDPWLDTQIIDTSKPRLTYYQQSYWRGQRYFPELWLEKDALRGFFEPYARRYRVNLVICRGYPSVTRLREAKEQRHVPPGVSYVVLYFGDHDPSGEDIFRWVNEELRPYEIEVRKVALTREQVRRYRLPPMIPKRSDPRTPGFVRRYGEEAVELDALHPAVLRDLIRRSILEYMDLARRLEVEVAEQMELEAQMIVDEVLREVRRRLHELAVARIRGHVSRALPSAYQSLLRRLERGEDLSLDGLYPRDQVFRAVREALRRMGAP